MRKQGWTSKRLPDDRRDAYREADELNRQLDLWRQGLAETPLKEPAPIRGSLAWLIREYRASDAWTKLRERTKKDYARHLDAIKAWAGNHQVRAITARTVYAYRSVCLKIGARQGPMRMQVLRILLSHAVRIGELASNPASNPGISMPKSRDAIWSPEQIQAFAAVAGEQMRTAMMLGIWTGQRLGDVLAMRWTDIRDGRIDIQQSKTLKRVSIPISGPLADHLNGLKRESLMVLHNKGTPWRDPVFRNAWRRAQSKAGVTGVAFIDLRRTSVCMLAEAGCTIPEIASITGHSITETQRIIDVYLKPTKKLADAAIRKLER
ncbi:tyrosine-type recombinase/integrase [Geminicoccus harenae]|uniref:tyrosine-type recombinase/integrase n=1 Tax=Geminicoccus harenae TaxID=2498453 RepID=UPI00168B5432|nr:tyrosine-type recombinase/integrase [Geminicoccus harenae]